MNENQDSLLAFRVWRTGPLKQVLMAEREMRSFPWTALTSSSWVTVPKDMNTKHIKQNRHSEDYFLPSFPPPFQRVSAPGLASPVYKDS